ncbi:MULTISPECIES: hypothetical protein [unclassified Paraflavitalea]|uniref:hypothetical protein n=1 Tax=unclassified Paraflavitalea TaxID=2798305 RepID=UPI003D34F634
MNLELSILILIGFNVCNAFIDAYKITVLHREIRHAINFSAYAILVWILIHLLEYNAARSISFCLFSFFIRQITFDIPLNWRRGLSTFYVSTANPPKAIWDRIEIWIFGKDGGRKQVEWYLAGSALTITILIFSQYGS